MTIAADSGNESPNIVKRMRSSISDAFATVRDKTPNSEQVKESIGDQTARVGDAYNQLWGRDLARLAQLFKDWAPSMEKDKLVAKRLAEETDAFLTWSNDLSEAEQKEFAHRLYDISASMDLNLNWLLDPEIAKYVEAGLKQSLGEILHLYCLAYWKSQQIQDDVETLVKLRSWMDKPDKKENAEFNEQVFTKLVAEDLIPAPPVELFLASEEERRSYSVEAIKSFIESDTQRFYELLKLPAGEAAPEVIAEEETAEATADDAK